jgi:uncharacterized protein involved in type VI secretion and phage assembly
MRVRLTELLDDLARNRGNGRIAGVVTGKVTNNSDPDGLGRVKVRFPWLSDTDESFWARVSAPMAGNDRGAYFLPEVDDEVLVLFEQGDVRFPFVIGSLWNGQAVAPADNSDGGNNVRVIKSRSGHVIKLDDTDGKEVIQIIDGSGNNSVVIDTANNTVTITAGKDLVLGAPNGAIKLTAQSIDIHSNAETKISAGAGMNVTATAGLALKGSPIDIN